MYREYFEQVELMFSLCNRWSGSRWHFPILHPTSRQCLPIKAHSSHRILYHHKIF